MSTPRFADQPERLWELVRTACDNLASPADWDELNSVLRDNGQARSLYLSYFALNAELRWRYRDDQEMAIESFSDATEGSPSTHARAAYPIFATGLLAQAAKGLDFRRHPLRFAVASLAIVAVFWTAWAYLIYAQRTAYMNHPGGDRKAPVATLRATEECKWASPEQSNLPGDKLRPGQTINLDAGIAELELTLGTRIVVQGPAEFELKSNNSAFLRHGKLVAKVPPAATGFTINTKTATVVDLGTEFGVVADESGATDVNVFRGSVTVQAIPRSAKQPAQPHVVRAGEVRRVSEHGRMTSTASTAAVDWRPLATRVGVVVAQRSRGPSKLIVGETARASSQFSDDFGAIHAVDDSGLIEPSNPPGGAGHSTNLTPSPNKWLSVRETIDAEKYLLITLPEVYEIDRIHVWNYNEITGSSRGIRSAEIHYSATDAEGKEQTLGTFEFAPAAASEGLELGAEYLGQDFGVSGADFRRPFRAKYIRLEIQSNWSGKPEDGYGLSEIQFYGRHIAADESATQ